MTCRSISETTHTCSTICVCYDGNQVTKAVITVPAKFTPAQKKATGEAYKRAGLKVLREVGLAAGGGRGGGSAHPSSS
jgi:hypothetical protein